MEGFVKYLIAFFFFFQFLVPSSVTKKYRIWGFRNKWASVISHSYCIKGILYLFSLTSVACINKESIHLTITHLRDTMKLPHNMLRTRGAQRIQKQVVSLRVPNTNFIVPRLSERFQQRWKSENVSLSVQFSSVAQSCLTLCDPMNRSTPGLPVDHKLPEFTQSHVHQVGDAIRPSHPLSSPSPPAPNPSQN